MYSDKALNRLLTHIAGLSRRQCIDHLLHFRGLHLDFDRPTLENMSTDRLRHVLMAAIHTHNKYHRARRAAV